MLPGEPTTLIGLDINTTRARAVGRPLDGMPRNLMLDGDQADMPLMISLAGRRPVVGHSGRSFCRQAPYLTCQSFLPWLGQPRLWAAGRHRLNAGQALSLVFAHLKALCSQAQTMDLVIPAYLSHEQGQMAADLATKAGLMVYGWLTTPLAATLGAFAEQPWFGPALVVDVDDHALTWSGVTLQGGQARVYEVQAFPSLGMGAWTNKLLNAVADRCIRQSRRDPRDSAEAEQALHDQFDEVLSACSRGQIAELVIQMAHWGQNLILRPEEVIGTCASLLDRALAPLAGLRASLPVESSPGVLLVTAAASRLPGLMAALEEKVGRSVPLPTSEPPEEDFGEALFEDEACRAAVSILSVDVPARAACELAGRGDLPRGFLSAAPLPPPLPFSPGVAGLSNPGPARIQFRNQDYLLRGKSFVLGRHPECDLVFDSTLYPSVSSRHCEIIFDCRSYVLRDRSRNGTLVNERPVIHEIVLQAGDWIRLGPGGPLVRFLGQAADQIKLMTTA
jgi:hypothetical protein